MTSKYVRISVAVVAALAVAIPAAALAKSKTVTLKSSKCPTKIDTKPPGKVGFNCTLKGSGTTAKLSSAFVPNAKSTISGTFKLTVKGKTKTYKMNGPIGPDSQQRIVIKGKYKGKGGAKGTWTSLSPPNDPTGTPSLTLKGTL
jgi:hypothetical protein